MSKSKILNLLVIISSLFGYLEWGQDNSTFLFQAEYQVLHGLFTNISSAAHPLTLIPLFGQLLLIFTLFQKEPGKVLSYIGIASLAVLLVFMFFIGIISFNFKVILSTLPFILFSILAIRHYRKK